MLNDNDSENGCLLINMISTNLSVRRKMLSKGFYCCDDKEYEMIKFKVAFNFRNIF